MITGGILKASLEYFRTCHIKNGNKGDIAHTWGRGGSSSSFLAQIYVFVKPCIYQFIRWHRNLGAFNPNGKQPMWGWLCWVVMYPWKWYQPVFLYILFLSWIQRYNDKKIKGYKDKKIQIYKDMKKKKQMKGCKLVLHVLQRYSLKAKFLLLQFWICSHNA